MINIHLNPLYQTIKFINFRELFKMTSLLLKLQAANEHLNYNWLESVIISCGLVFIGAAQCTSCTFSKMND